MLDQPQTTNHQPPLRGWVSTYFVNQRGHRFGPYHVRVWKRHGKTYKQYIKPGQLETVQARCQAYREKRARQRALAHDLTRTTGNLNFLTRMLKRVQRGDLRPEDYAHIALIETQGFNVPGRPSLRSPKTPLMVPPLAKFLRELDREDRIHNRLMKHALKAFKQIRKEERLKETSEEKWNRWQEEIAARPTPRRRPPVELPDWITIDEIEDQVRSICNPPQASRRSE